MIKREMSNKHDCSWIEKKINKKVWKKKYGKKKYEKQNLIQKKNYKKILGEKNSYQDMNIDW